MASAVWVLGFCWASSSAMAVEAPSTDPQSLAADDSAHLEDVVVTARRTDEPLQRTPVAITAITPQAMEELQLHDINDVERSAPGLVLSPNGGANSDAVYVAIRGNTQVNLISTADNAVGIYVDGVYIARAQTGNLALDDLSGVEVLRGPQGTLFGRNTTGGAISLTTNDPDPTKFAGWTRVDFGNYNQRDAAALVNIPLTDEFAVRAYGSYAQHSGYLSAPFHDGDFDDVNADYNARVAFRWTPSELPLTWKVSADYSHYRDNGTDGAFFTDPSVALFPTSTAYVASKSNFWTSYGDSHSGISEIDNSFNGNIDTGVSSNFDIDLGPVHLKSITAWRHSDSQNANDGDSSPIEILSFISRYEQSQFSQELQAHGSIGPIDYTSGFYYFRETGVDSGDSDALPSFGVAYSRSDADYSATSKGPFAQLNYHLTDRLRLTGGMRYTWDERGIVSHATEFPNTPDAIVNGVLNNAIAVCNAGANSGVPLATLAGGCNDPHSAHYDYPAWTANLDYQLTDGVFTYVKTSGAALAGGLNSREFPPGFAAFAPEKVKDVEGGFKADLFDRRVRLNTAVYYMERNNVQNVVNEFVDGVLANFIANAGDTRTYGVEFEGTVLPWSGMQIDTSISNLHSKYKAGTFIVEGADGPYDRSGEPVLYAPRWTANIGGTQDFNLPMGKLSVHADYYYMSSFAYFSDSPDSSVPVSAATAHTYTLVNAYSQIDSRGILNGKINFRFANPDVDISLWGRNLGDYKYYTNGLNFISSLGFAEKYQGAPRTFGLSATYHW